MKDYIAFYFSKTFPGIDVPASLSKSIRLVDSHRSSSVLVQLVQDALLTFYFQAKLG